MPTWNFKPADSMENTVLELIRQMGWMFSKLDSKNVKRLDTNETTVKSADGTTYINGPVLQMTDATTQMRLEMGYEASSGDFIFKLYDADGNLTIDLNSLGEAVFKGNIETAKNATIGEILKLVSPTSTFNSGIQWISNDGTTVLARQLFITDTLYTNNYFGDIDMLAAGGMILKSSAGDISLDPGASSVNIGVSGSKLGFFGVAVPVIKQSVTAPSSITTTETAGAAYTATEQAMLGHLKTDVTNLRSRLNTLITALDAYGLV
jgi:hypothetical protein